MVISSSDAGAFSHSRQARGEKILSVLRRGWIGFFDRRACAGLLDVKVELLTLLSAPAAAKRSVPPDPRCHHAAPPTEAAYVPVPGGHAINFSGVTWELAMRRTVAFFDHYLKGAS